MDSFEVSRQRAERLHADAVAAGHDPWKPYDVRPRGSRQAETRGREGAEGRRPPLRWPGAL